MKKCKLVAHVETFSARANIFGSPRATQPLETFQWVWKWAWNRNLKFALRSPVTGVFAERYTRTPSSHRNKCQSNYINIFIRFHRLNRINLKCPCSKGESRVSVCTKQAVNSNQFYIKCHLWPETFLLFLSPQAVGVSVVEIRWERRLFAALPLWSPSAVCVIHSSGDHLVSFLLSLLPSLCTLKSNQFKGTLFCWWWHLSTASKHNERLSASHVIHFLCFYQFPSFPPSRHFSSPPSVLLSVPQHHSSLIFSFNHSCLSGVRLLISLRCTTEKTTFEIHHFQPIAS